MANIRINDLARELEVKSKVILDALTAVGFTEKKTHSSAVDESVAERVRRHLRGESEPEAAALEPAPATPQPEAKAEPSRPSAPEAQSPRSRLRRPPPP